MTKPKIAFYNQKQQLLPRKKLEAVKKIKFWRAVVIFTVQSRLLTPQKIGQRKFHSNAPKHLNYFSESPCFLPSGPS